MEAQKSWTLVGAGRNRIVYRRGNYVVKVPLNEEGVYDNHFERRTFLKYGNGEKAYVKYARCRMKGGLLIMQFARFPGPNSTETGFIPWKHLPSWAGSVDCCQVGYNRFGQLVAYDYGRF